MTKAVTGRNKKRQIRDFYSFDPLVFKWALLEIIHVQHYNICMSANNKYNCLNHRLSVNIMDILRILCEYSLDMEQLALNFGLPLMV